MTRNEARALKEQIRVLRARREAGELTMTAYDAALPQARVTGGYLAGLAGPALAVRYRDGELCVCVEAGPWQPGLPPYMGNLVFPGYQDVTLVTGGGPPPASIVNSALRAGHEAGLDQIAQRLDTGEDMLSIAGLGGLLGGLPASPAPGQPGDCVPGGPCCRRGDRVALEHTSDPCTRLRRGDTGTVTGHDRRAGQILIRWDNGSALAMLPAAAGDRIRLIPAP